MIVFVHDYICSPGGADSAEMRAPHRGARAGAGALRAGDGPRAALHDQEGSDQHGGPGGQPAPAAGEVPLGEYRPPGQLHW